MCAKKRKIITLAVLILFFMILLVIRQFLGFIIVHGGSMEPTYQNGDLLLSNKASKTNGIKGVNKKPTALLARLSTRHSVPPSPATIVPTSA